MNDSETFTGPKSLGAKPVTGGARPLRRAYRRGDDLIAVAARREPARRAGFICECSDDDCADRVPVTVLEFDASRELAGNRAQLGNELGERRLERPGHTLSVACSANDAGPIPRDLAATRVCDVDDSGNQHG